MMYFFSEVFFSILAETSKKSATIYGARLALVDDDGDRRELQEDGGHRPGVLASQMMKNDE
jgi:hypothetical protein